MTKEVSKYLGIPAAILALAVVIAAVLALSGFARADDLRVLSDKHNADILRVERKLDCALFDLPYNCRQLMAPREP